MIDPASFMTWTLVFDAIIIAALFVLIFLFFIRRNSVRLAVILLLYALAASAVNIVWVFTPMHALYITAKVLDFVSLFIIVACAVVYQQDLKAFFARIARPKNKSSKLSIYTDSEEALVKAASEIVKACQMMSKNDIGALILIAPTSVPPHIVETGTELNAQLSAELLQSIFFPKTPLHDGAVVIKGKSIIAAGCFLPLSENSKIAKDLGTRHRAAIGISEQSDVLAIVVSEETGIISIVKKGVIKRYITPEKLYEAIEAAYGIDYKEILQKDEDDEIV